ncbi:site-specific integrase [Georgenia sp. EYE_87]|uniref:tyrosine-type recombinase/integrase n=1 Tax=Georgenia sp. EYE_87 TaxID=2853448 RepID=UPI0020044855|nr:tyrosine-type recombinase/integrase [Georgenia sp. EYE_87]MCK6212094.1 site-specific integrase [Georgenia sp. EYE_87]
MGDEDYGGPEIEAVIARVIERYQPRSPRAKAYWWRTAEFVRDCVRAVGPRTKPAAFELLRATSGFVAWCLDEGDELSPEVMFTEPKVERFVLVGIKDLNEKSRANYRAALHQVGRRVTRRVPWPPLRVDLSLRSPLAPYGDGELDLILHSLSIQANNIRQRAGLAVATLIYGAGLQTAEMFRVSATDVRQQGRSYVVDVSGARSRTVPVLPKARPCVRELLDLGVEGALVSEKKRHRRTVAGELVAMLELPPAAPVLSFNRLRKTWLVTVAHAGLRISEIMHLAGWTSASSLTAILPYVEMRDAETVLSLIEGSDGDESLEKS